MKWQLREDFDRAKIALMVGTAVEYGITGYADDLQYYQGAESIYKARQIAGHMSADRGAELLAYIEASNARMEATPA